MNQKSFVKRILAVALSIIMVLGLMPMNALASDAFPGKPDGMTVSGSSTETINGQTVWLCPNSGGEIAKTTSGNDYAIYEALPYGGYTFSHWATYCVADDWWNTFESANRYDEEEGYAFSKPDSKTARYDEKDDQIRVNTSNEANYTYYVYAVFVQGVSVSISVEGGGAYIIAKNVDNYNSSAGEYEHYVRNAEGTVHFGVGENSEMQVQIESDWATYYEHVYVNGVDVIDSSYVYYFEFGSDRRHFYSQRFTVTEPITIRAVTKKRGVNVTFYSNDVNATGTMEKQFLQCYEYCIIPENQFVNKGYIFSGWNTKADGTGTPYTDKQSVRFTIADDGTELSLYAQWTKCNNHTWTNGECTKCGAICSHSGGTVTCLEQAVCTVCGLKYGSPLDHQYVYSVKDNVITEKCTNGCNHSETATLEQDTDVNTFYTGNAIEALDITYSDGWQGGNLTINYSDNTNVGTAKGSISIGNAEVEQTFEISYFSVSGNAYSISGEAYINESVYWFGGSHMTATVTPAADYQISKEQSGSYTDSIVFNNGDEKVYLKRISDGAISDAIDLSDIVKFDATLPTGEIRLDERNGWQKFVNFVTFGLFYREDAAATVIYSDADSGVKSVEYYLASEDLIADESLDNAAAAEKLEAAIGANWNTYSTKIDLNDNAKNVIYVKITDNVGNVTYLNSDGIMLDSIAPTLEGIENGQTYYGDLTVIKSDEQFYDIKVVTLDGEPMGFAEGTYGLIRADNAEHTVVVEDHAGNKTTYTVTVMKNYTVTYKADGETVAEITVGHGENAAFPKVPAKDGYVGKWDRNNENITSDTVINAVYTEIPVVKPDEVKPEDKTDLVDTKEKLEEQLKDDSYTEDDKKDIQDAIDNIDDALEVIGNVDEVEELIDKLPDTIKKDDEAAIEAADDAYNALTDYEKSLVDGDAKKALENAKAALDELNKPVTDPNSPQTGDNSNIALWIALLFISGGAIITLTVVDRKRRSAANK